MGDGGKGSAPRPLGIDWNEFDKAWERIFGGNDANQAKVQREEGSDQEVHPGSEKTSDSQGDR
jgi:hypothetical protein